MVGSHGSAPRYYYVYNGHGDVIGLVDANGTAVATYAYDAWGVVTVNTESFANGWHNPYLYDGRDGVRYDTETGLSWMSVRAYDPTLGRFISRDPLGRAPLMGWTTQPYAYAGNNPLLNVDPSGQRFVMAAGAQEGTLVKYAKNMARIQARHPIRAKRLCEGRHPSCAQIDRAKGDAQNAAVEFAFLWGIGSGGAAGTLAWFSSVAWGRTVADWTKNMLLKLGKWLLSKMNLALSGEAAGAFLNSAWLTFAVANIVVGALFYLQAMGSDAYWMDSSQVPSVLGWIRVAFITAGFILLLGSVVSSIASPEIAWLWWGAVGGLAAAYWEIAPRALADLHSEQYDLGYQYTY